LLFFSLHLVTSERPTTPEDGESYVSNSAQDENDADFSDENPEPTAPKKTPKSVTAAETKRKKLNAVKSPNPKRGERAPGIWKKNEANKEARVMDGKGIIFIFK